tara:strand:- start:75 stop:284 length:210 start_codon:yes stop_codon:yes gene_type:complete
VIRLGEISSDCGSKWLKNPIGSFKIAVQDNDFSLFEKDLTNDLVRDELNNGIFDYGSPALLEASSYEDG